MGGGGWGGSETVRGPQKRIERRGDDCCPYLIDNWGNSSYKNTDTKRRNKKIPGVKNKTFLFLNFIHFRKVMDETERERHAYLHTHSNIRDTHTGFVFWWRGVVVVVVVVVFVIRVHKNFFSFSSLLTECTQKANYK